MFNRNHSVIGIALVLGFITGTISRLNLFPVVVSWLVIGLEFIGIILLSIVAAGIFGWIIIKWV